MGDMADMLYEQELNYELTHGMGGEYYMPQACKYCGEGDLFWEQTEFGWRLFSHEDMKMHSCQAFHKGKSS